MTQNRPTTRINKATPEQKIRQQNLNQLLSYIRSTWGFGCYTARSAIVQLKALRAREQTRRMHSIIDEDLKRLRIYHKEDKDD